MNIFPKAYPFLIDRITRIILLLTVTVIVNFLSTAASASEGTKVMINGRILSDIRLRAVSDRVLVPVEQIGEALELGVERNAETVVLTKGEASLEFSAGSKDVWSGGKAFCLDVPPQEWDGLFYVPLRFLCESLGAGVVYSDGTVKVEYPSGRGDDIVLNFAGDTTLAWAFEDAVGDDFDYPFAGAPWFREADITMINLENAVTDRGYKVPKEFNFRMPPKYIKVLLNGGIDIVNLANNHVWDYGAVGVRDTITYLDEAGIRHVGAGETFADNGEPVILEVKGKRIGFLGYYFHEGDLVADVSTLKQSADVVVVNFHWGTERSNYAENYQVDLAHMAIDAGADLIIGHHPHVLQGMERYNGGVIAYSLGNFIFGGNNRRQHDTVVFQLIIRGGEKIPAVIPVRVSDWQPYWLKDEGGRSIIDSIKEYSRDFKDPLL